MRRLPFLLCVFLAASPAAAQTVLDPTAPIGIEAGRFTIFPAVETNAAWTTGNAITPGWSVTISPEIRFQSDWSAHSVELFLDADFSPIGGTVLATLAELNVRFDLTALWTLDAGATYELGPRNANDAALPPGVDAIPNIRTAGANATLAGPIGNFDVQLNADVERHIHDDAMVSGVPVDQSERDNTIVTATLRLQTGAGAVLRPFVEATGGRRFYDQLVGGDGFLQASNFAGLRGGITYDSGPVLTAEIGVGYHWELPDDPGLANSAAWTIDANAVWSPREPISFALAALTTFTADASPVWGDSITRSVDIAAAWDIRAVVQFTAQGGYAIERYSDGTVERAASAGGGLAWSPNRLIRFSLSYVQQWLWSPDPTRAGTTGTLALTVRAQR